MYSHIVTAKEDYINLVYFSLVHYVSNLGTHQM